MLCCAFSAAADVLLLLLLLGPAAPELLLLLRIPCPRSGGGKCLYISGIPGTGKTATVLEVMRGLKRKRWAAAPAPMPGWLAAARRQNPAHPSQCTAQSSGAGQPTLVCAALLPELPSSPPVNTHAW